MRTKESKPWDNIDDNGVVSHDHDQLFINILNELNYSYKIVNDVIIIDEDGDVDLSYFKLTQIDNYKIFGDFFELHSKIWKLSENIIFQNNGNVDLSFNDIRKIPKNVIFRNNGNVDLRYNRLTSVPSKYKIQNKRNLFFRYNKINLNFPTKKGTVKTTKLETEKIAGKTVTWYKFNGLDNEGCVKFNDTIIGKYQNWNFIDAEKNPINYENNGEGDEKEAIGRYI